MSKAPNDLSEAIQAELVEFAEPFHECARRIVKLQQQNADFLEQHRATYDEWYSRLQHLPEQTQKDFFSAEKTIVDEIEQRCADLIQYRDNIYAVRAQAIVNAAAYLGRAHQHGTEGAPLLDAYRADFDVLRQWRRQHLDGIDSDMAPLIVERRPEKTMRLGAAPLFDRCFAAWAVAMEGREVGSVKAAKSLVAGMGGKLRDSLERQLEQAAQSFGMASGM